MPFHNKMKKIKCKYHPYAIHKTTECCLADKLKNKPCYICGKKGHHPLLCSLFSIELLGQDRA